VQNANFGSFGAFLVSPNLPLVLTVSYALIRGSRSGLVLGFFCGLMRDVYFGEILGFYALIYMYLGFMGGAFADLFFPEDIKLPLCLITFSELLYSLVVYFMMFALRGQLELYEYLRLVILPELVFTVAITVPSYPLLLFLDRKLEKRELLSEESEKNRS